MREIGLAEITSTTDSPATYEPRSSELDCDAPAAQSPDDDCLDSQLGDAEPVPEPIVDRAAASRPALMTGADLLARAMAREADRPLGFSVGMSVRHPRYGIGRIVKVSGFARNRVITVEFNDDGRRETFIASKNPLQPVGNS